MPTEGPANINTLEKKLHQLIICRLDGDKIGSQVYQEEIFDLVRKGIGGFILFGGRKDEIKRFIRSIQSRVEIPLLIASDIERGVGQQVTGTTLFPCQMAMASAINKNVSEDVATLEKMLEALSNESKDIGINMPLIPVLDINQNPDNPIICTRSFSDEPEDVVWFGMEYIKILENSGLISCAKHFPGHGDTSTDSHIELPIIKKSYNDLMDIDLMPFKEAIKNGVSSIMVGHLSIPAVDSQPSSLSSRIITNILRDGLGFEGLVITDALNMHALKDIDNISVKCMKAGIDMLLHPVNVEHTIKELISAIKQSDLKEERIDDAVSRIINVKKKVIHREKKIRYDEHKKLSSRLTEDSITIIKSSSGILPLSRSNKNHLIFSGDRKLFKSSALTTCFKNVSQINDRVNIKDKIVICAIFTNVTAWLGSSGIDEDEKNQIKEVIKKARKSIVISFGSPYVLRHFQESDVLIAAYESTINAQKAAIKCLKSEIDCKGRLPVKLEFQN